MAIKAHRILLRSIYIQARHFSSDDSSDLVFDTFYFKSLWKHCKDQIPLTEVSEKKQKNESALQH